MFQISILEANSCCDSLILYDGYIGAPVIQKLVIFHTIFLKFSFMQIFEILQ